MELNIMTWNTRLYEYENKIDGKIKKLDGNEDLIIDKIKEHLNNENAIAVLQEIPYKCNATRKYPFPEHVLFEKIKDTFDEDYDFIFDKTYNQYQIKMTAVISKKGLIVPGKKIRSTESLSTATFLSISKILI